MLHARPLWTSTLQELSNGIKNTPMQGVLTSELELWVFGSLEGLQVLTFGSVSFILTLNPKWGCDNRRSLFALNRCCAGLCIMDVKLRIDLFNMLVHSITSYACEVWVDSKKIETIEVVYRRFLKSLLGVWKTTITSIVLVEFCKFPFEHFAWG